MCNVECSMLNEDRAGHPSFNIEHSTFNIPLFTTFPPRPSFLRTSRFMQEITVAATLDRDVTRSALEAARGVASWLEVRGDLAGEVDVARLRRHFPGKLLFALRSRGERGASDATSSERRERLIRAAQHY